MSCDLSFSHLLSFVGKQIVVSESFNQSTRGVLKVVDPETCTCIVVTESAIRFIPRPSIIRITEQSETTDPALTASSVLFDTRRISSVESVQQSAESLDKRKNTVLHVLGQNRLPFEKSHDRILVLGCVEIHPPYGPESCYSANEIVLRKIRSLLS